MKIDKCSICKDIVDFADEFIDSNKTEVHVHVYIHIYLYVCFNER